MELIIHVRVSMILNVKRYLLRFLDLIANRMLVRIRINDKSIRMGLGSK